ncbi:pantoate--beta-alanine ligase [Paucihalobacter ruber]|uniref:Pantothenate synthetase n=1 Tax=Paucihalobacter ruber TaxID=2567861 RepID=A0A506PM79_9FLAO|nr:pantoate--beta-alanine ligase [Paucihalobacter ruber]TPV34724.1 pantoate--beta-alanine ligase [Paucihalobacter ruber]
MKVFELKKNLEAYLLDFRKSAKTIGLVPTMGALHSGHLALVKQALLDNHVVVVTIFVNPTQFNNSEDLIKYPRTLESDLKALNTLTPDNIVVYAPPVKDVYPQGIVSKQYNLGYIEHEMEGKFRPGHFQGVATIVENLFDIVKPNKAYFGEKDYQQLQIIKKLVEITGQPIEIIPCSILRESDGLAMSSRNQRLTPAHREAAPFIYKTLKAAKKKFGTKSASEVTNWVVNEFKKNKFLELEYFAIADQSTLKPVMRKQKFKKYRAFVAAFAGDIRLIDNIALN